MGKHALKKFSLLKILHNEPESMAALPSLRMLECSAIDEESGAISSRQTAVRQSNVEDEAQELKLVGFFYDDASHVACFTDVPSNCIIVEPSDSLAEAVVSFYKTRLCSCLASHSNLERDSFGE